MAKKTAGQAALTRTRQVDVPVFAALEKRTLHLAVRAKDIEQGVVVAVENGNVRCHWNHSF
jgi:hypothetical protein